MSGNRQDSGGRNLHLTASLRKVGVKVGPASQQTQKGDRNMNCVCYICGSQYRTKAPFDDHQISHGLCERCFPNELMRMKREVAAFRASGKGRSVSERNRHLPKRFDDLDLV